MSSSEPVKDKDQADKREEQKPADKHPAPAPPQDPVVVREGIKTNSSPKTEAPGSQHGQGSTFKQERPKLGWLLGGAHGVIELIFAGAVAYFAYAQCQIGNQQWGAMVEQNKLMESQIAQTTQTLDIMRKEIAPQVTFSELSVPFDPNVEAVVSVKFKNPGGTIANVSSGKIVLYPIKPGTKRSEINALFEKAPMDNRIDFQVSPGGGEFTLQYNTKQRLEANIIRDIRAGKSALFVAVRYHYTGDVGTDTFATRILEYNRSAKSFRTAPND